MRTRFAPSPTGFMHVGALRTALYAYIIAKKSGDEFLLRVEDTDQERSVVGAVEDFLETLSWAGLYPDEGVVLKNGAITETGSKGPYIQSARLEIYQKHAKKLLDKGHVYPCFCHTDRLVQMRKDQMSRKEAPMYDRLCLSLSKEEVQKKIDAREPYALRMKIPHEGLITFEDDIRGRVEFKGWTIDDQVILKSDGFPTYHLAHVIDDHLMDIGLIIRGEEWLSSLPKHLILFQNLGWKAPRYAHVPLLLNKDKTKLSKRQNAVSVGEYIDKGYLPEALINFIALLGWNPGTPQEIFSLEELINEFSVEKIQKSGAIFDTDKLDWLQGQWIRKIPIQEFVTHIRPIVEERYPEAKHDTGFKDKATLIQERITYFNEAPDMLSFFYEEPSVDKKILANKKQKVTEEQLPEIFSLLIEKIDSNSHWSEESLKKELFALAEEKDYKRGQILWPLRAALTGLEYSPGAFEVATVLGKDETLKRLKKNKEAVN